MNYGIQKRMGPVSWNTGRKKKMLTIEEKIKVNKLFWDDIPPKAMTEIRHQLKMSISVLERELFVTRQQWHDFKAAENVG